MGYSYDAGGHLCCDVCDKPGGVRKYRCPFGYCPAIALCPECKAKHPEYISREGHRQHGCEKAHLEFEQREDQAKALVAWGEYLRCAAMGHNGRVKVLFRGQDGEKAYFMAHETYRAIPIGVNATIEDYRKFGELTECENINLYENK